MIYDGKGLWGGGGNVMYIFFQDNTSQPKRTNFIPTQIQVNTLIKSPLSVPITSLDLETAKSVDFIT